jgi:hypothetical protein
MAHYQNVMILETQNVTSFSLTSNAVCSLPIQDSYNSQYLVPYHSRPTEQLRNIPCRNRSHLLRGHEAVRQKLWQGGQRAWKERKTRNRKKTNWILCESASKPLSERLCCWTRQILQYTGENIRVNREPQPWPSEHCGVCFSNYLRMRICLLIYGLNDVLSISECWRRVVVWLGMYNWKGSGSKPSCLNIRVSHNRLKWPNGFRVG